MLDSSLFVSTSVQEREIKLPDGKTHVLYFKELPAIEFTRYFNAANSKDEDSQLYASAKLIAAGLCDADGKKAITVEQAAQLKPGPLGAILEALRDVNGLGDEKKD